MQYKIAIAAFRSKRVEVERTCLHFHFAQTIVPKGASYVSGMRTDPDGNVQLQFSALKGTDCPAAAIPTCHAPWAVQEGF